MTPLLLIPRILENTVQAECWLEAFRNGSKGCVTQLEVNPSGSPLAAVIKGLFLGTHEVPEGLKCDTLATHPERVFSTTFEGNKRTKLFF